MGARYSVSPDGSGGADDGGFLKSVDAFVARTGVDVVQFKKGERKDEVTQDYLARFRGAEGVLYVGKAQEKARVMRTERRRNPRTGGTYPWIVSSTAMVNHLYFYCVDEDFGPLFLKFCTYFPYNAKLCLNGNEYAKCQLHKRGIAFEALDNGVHTCANPAALQRLCDGLDAARIDRLLRKWLKRLPHPFSKQDRASGCRYDISILQAEFSLTQVLDRPLAGRVLFEDVIRENLDIGRPASVQLIFNRRVGKLPRSLPHPRPHRRCNTFAACGLQAQPHQAVPQGGSGTAHRDHDQRYLRFRPGTTAA